MEWDTVMLWLTRALIGVCARMMLHCSTIMANLADFSSSQSLYIFHWAQGGSISAVILGLLYSFQERLVNSHL
jgi:hypothetical protein